MDEPLTGTLGRGLGGRAGLGEEIGRRPLDQRFWTGSNWETRIWLSFVLEPVPSALAHAARHPQGSFGKTKCVIYLKIAVKAI